MRTIGQQLQNAREGRGLSIEDVAFHTRIPPARVRDMESDDLTGFANLTYARGFLKLYAAYLELDLSDYLGQFRTEDFAHASGREYVQTANATNNLPASAVVDQARSRRPGVYILAAALLGIVAVIKWNSGNRAANSTANVQRGELAPSTLSQPLMSEPDAGAGALAPSVSPPPAVAVDLSAVSPAAQASPGISRAHEPPPRAKLVEESEP